VLVIDHAKKPGRKILISGGGHCNFTNYHISSDNYISHNPHFCKSSLSRFTQWDFLTLVQKHHIPFSEKTKGQLFCQRSSRDILNMLLSECEQAGVSFQVNTKIEKIKHSGKHQFEVYTSQGNFLCQSLVVATGGLSIPEIGASPLGYEIARQFHLKVWPQRAGLVPFTLQPRDRGKLATLSGIAVDAVVTNKRQSFSGNILFTHRGLSGSAILQISSYWQPGEELRINLLPEIDLVDLLKEQQQKYPHRKVKSVLAEYLPKRLVETLLKSDLAETPLQRTSHQKFKEISALIQQWAIRPGGTEGYRTAEVTLGGVDCDAISSKTMEAHLVAGLFFIGEVLDVSGWLGGYNLQWAWSSGWCAGQSV
ncbi:MAG TPA: NAD(P)/FAD-dependent oxidoreductase, partial [Terriglobales bacterium]|nr:NAD(P)/FAD-dependent oxidoreductase [Terriglobales bacterium]